MKVRMIKVFVLLLAMMLITCAGAGCSKKTEEKTSEAASKEEKSEASSETSKEESEASEESVEPEEESDEEPEEAAEEESAEEEPAEEEPVEEEPVEEPEDAGESEAEAADDSARFVGEWEYNVGSAYMSMILEADGNVQAAANEINGTMLGTWYADGDRVIVTIYGADTGYTFDGEHLVEDESGRVFFKRD